MDQNGLSTPLSERKMVRRGLMGALAAIGAAAMLKASGTEKAYAADLLLASTANTQASETRLTMSPATNETALQVVNGGGDYSIDRVGVVGYVGGSNGQSYGLAGLNTATATTATGVIGQIVGGGPGRGVFGYAGSGFGVDGLATVVGGIGVRGRSNFGSGIGVQGQSTSGPGVKGESQTGYGVWGTTNNAAGVLGTTVVATGVEGAANGSGTGVVGTSIGGLGVSGSSTNFVGALGLSTNSIGVYASTGAPSTAALYAESTANTNRVAGIFMGDVSVQGNFTVMGGAKAAGVTLADGSQATMYCQESPEPYFEDFGRAQLAGGVAQVTLEPRFASLVHLGGYLVFLTPAGDSDGLYISRQDDNGFEVREQRGGKSSLAFNYRVVAKRKDIPGARLAAIDPQPVAKTKALQKPAAPRPDVSPADFVSSPMMPLSGRVGGANPGGGPVVAPPSGPQAPMPIVPQGGSNPAAPGQGSMAPR